MKNLLLLILFFQVGIATAQLFEVQEDLSISDSATNSWTVNFIDINVDGFDDLFIPSYEDSVPNRFYINQQDGTFELAPPDVDLENQNGSIAATWADMDNDADLDAAVSPNGGRPYLLINDGVGNFELKEVGTGLDSASGQNHGTAFSDYNLDGILDLFVTNFRLDQESWLCSGLGEGEFEVVPSEMSALLGRSVGSTWADYNNDGFPDVFIPNGNNALNGLFRNNGDGTWTRILSGDIGVDATNSVASCWGDFDNDKDLDLFVSNASNQNNLLYRNDDGVFNKVLTGPVSFDAGHSHDCNFEDIDNDMDLDLFVVNDQLQENYLYINDGFGNFTRDTIEPLVYSSGNNYGTAWSDYDRDGDRDVIIVTHSADTDRVFRNNTEGNFVDLTLVGTVLGYSAIGSRVEVLAGDVWQLREINSQSGFGGQNSLRVHFGLGSETVIDSINIFWPSGETTALSNVLANQFITIYESGGSIISGQVYHDDNESCTLEASEFGVMSAFVEYETDRYVISGKDGIFATNIPYKPYTITYPGRNLWDGNCGEVYNVNAADGSVDNLNFSAQPQTSSVDLRAQMHGSFKDLNAVHTITLDYRNEGDITASEVEVLLMVPSAASINAASVIPPFSQFESAGDTAVYNWNIGTLVPGQWFEIYLEASVPPGLSQQDFMHFEMQINSVEVDARPINNRAVLKSIPAEGTEESLITVFPHGVGVEGFITRDDTLTYRINYRNIQPLPATRVEIRVPIPEQFDLSTLFVGIKDKTGEVRLDGRDLVWVFRNVSIPPSELDPVNGQGYVSFSIKPLQSLADLTALNMQAGISLNGYPYRFTNVTLNTIFGTEIDDPGPGTGYNLNGELAVMPNPMRGVTRIRHKPLKSADRASLNHIRIYDAAGSLFKDEQLNGAPEIVLHRRNFAVGMYLIVVTDMEGNDYVSKLMVDN